MEDDQITGVDDPDDDGTVEDDIVKDQEDNDKTKTENVHTADNQTIEDTEQDGSTGRSRHRRELKATHDGDSTHTTTRSTPPQSLECKPRLSNTKVIETNMSQKNVEKLNSAEQQCFLEVLCGWKQQTSVLML